MRRNFLLISICLLLGISFIAGETLVVPEEYTTIQAGLSAADSSDTVYVKAGTYQENIIWPDKNGIKLIGQDSSNTIIDGGGDGSVIYIDSQSVAIDSTTLIKNFTIQNGGNVRYGGGGFIKNCSPSMINIAIKQNSADEKGGGFYFKNSAPNIQNITVINNTAHDGGGICFNNSSPKMYNSDIINNSRSGVHYSYNSSGLHNDIFISKNTTNGSGGGINCSNSSPKFVDLCLKGNIAHEGGGIFIVDSSPELINTKILDNSLEAYGFIGGGGIYMRNSSTRLINVIIMRNSANDYGAGMCCEGSVPICKNLIVAKNSTHLRGGGIYFTDSSPTLENVIISENNSTEQGGGMYINSSSINLADITISANSANQGGGIYFNQSLDTLNNITLADNVGGIFINSGTPQINHNNFVNNDTAIYNADNSKTITAEDNYFGNPLGPYHPTQNISGKGDTVNAFVNIDPWLTEPDTSAPPIPIQNLEVVNQGNDFVTLSWSGSKLPDLNKYRIYYDTDTTDFFNYTDSIDVSKSDTSVTISGLSAGKAYYFAGITIDNDGNKSWYSQEISTVVKEASLILLTSDSLLFPTTLANDTTSQTINIKNIGTKELDITGLNITSNNFITTQNTISIPPSDSKNLEIVFKPKHYGTIIDTLTINNNSINSPEIKVILSGFGDLPPEPRISSISDIPDDQGGKVRIKFHRSKYDGLDDTFMIGSYSIWRLIEDGNWDAISTFDATTDSTYNFVAPTLHDSTNEGIHWSIFKITAHTSINDTLFVSEIDSGYSVDNIAPGVPEDIEIQSTQQHIMLTWKSNNEEDFQYYAIYKSKQPAFNPDTMNSATFATSDTFLTDNNLESNTIYYYKVSAIDHSGNESEYTKTVSTTFTGISNDNQQLPNKFTLSQNYPNPFNPTTTIKYGLPEKSIVQITIYNINGERVKSLISKDQSAGYHTVKWNASDVSSGVYFYRIQADNFTKVRKCVLME